MKYLSSFIALILLVVLLFVGFTKFHIPALVAKASPVVVTNASLPEAEKPVVAEPDRNPTSYADAVTLAKQYGKNMLLIFGADWCPYCRQMDNTTLKDESVKQELKRFVVYHVNTDKEKDIASKYIRGGIPQYKIVDKDEKVIKSGAGYMNTTKFKEFLTGSHDYFMLRDRARLFRNRIEWLMYQL